MMFSVFVYVHYVMVRDEPCYPLTFQDIHVNLECRLSLITLVLHDPFPYEVHTCTCNKIQNSEMTIDSQLPDLKARGTLEILFCRTMCMVVIV